MIWQAAIEELESWLYGEKWKLDDSITDPARKTCLFGGSDVQDYLEGS